MPAERRLVQNWKRWMEIAKIQVKAAVEKFHRRNCSLLFLGTVSAGVLVLAGNVFISTYIPIIASLVLLSLLSMYQRSIHQ